MNSSKRGIHCVYLFHCAILNVLRESNYRSITWAPAQANGGGVGGACRAVVWAVQCGECLHCSLASLAIPKCHSAIKWHKTNEMSIR